MKTSGGGGGRGKGSGIRFPFGFLHIHSRHCRQYRGKSPLHGAPEKERERTYNIDHVKNISLRDCK